MEHWTEKGSAISRTEALERLRTIARDGGEAGKDFPDGGRYIDQEEAHVLADTVLLDLIADDEIRDAWEAIDKWFA